MNARTKIIIYFLAGVLIGAAVIAAISWNKADPEATPVEMSAEGRPQYKWYVPRIPASMDFCGEAVPLDKWDVKEKLEREMIVNAYLHGSQLYIQKLTGRYLPIIKERLRANEMPEDLIYVCIAESALQQNAWSSVGAASFWQFMKGTAPNYGLEVNDEVDERFHVVKATDAACVYFKQAYERFGSWTAAAASYNCGMGGFSKQATFQGSNNYYELIFPEETNRYVFRILALKDLHSNPRKYGMIVPDAEKYKPLKTRTVTVDKTITNLATFAEENHISYKELKLYNPWLRAHSLTVRSGKTYEIEIPES